MKIRVVTSIISGLLLAIGQMTVMTPGQSAYCKNPSEPLKVYLRSYLSFGGKIPLDATTRITVARVKSEDGKTNEVIVYVSGPMWCGSGGCTMLILEPSKSSFRLLGKVTAVQLPIRLLPSVSNGHPDIGVLVQGGGVESGYEAVLSFNGKRYPKNPSMPPAMKISASQGTVLIATTENSVPLDR